MHVADDDDSFSFLQAISPDVVHFPVREQSARFRTDLAFLKSPEFVRQLFIDAAQRIVASFAFGCGKGAFSGIGKSGFPALEFDQAEYRVRAQNRSGQQRVKNVERNGVASVDRLFHHLHTGGISEPGGKGVSPAHEFKFCPAGFHG